MAFSTGSETIVMDLDANNVNTLVIKPATQYDNPVQSMLPVYRLEEGVKDKLKMTHLKKPKYSLQPGQSCDKWNPNVKHGLTNRTLTVCDFELNGEQCGDEWSRGCARNLQAVGNNRTDMTASATLSRILQAQAMQVSKGVSDDIFRIAYFGDKNFGTQDALFPEIDLSGAMSPEDAARLTAMVRNCEGWWSDIVSGVTSGIQSKRIKYVDSNDGSVDGNALNPANVKAYLQQMVRSSDPTLRFWNRNRPVAERPVFLLQSGIFNAYNDYLESLGTEIANTHILNGAEMPGVLIFNGYPVIEMPEWFMFDNEVGALQTSGDYINNSKYQRSLFVAQENLVMGYDAAPLEDMDASLVVQKSPLLKDKGKVWMYLALRMGFKVAHPELVTASYNSSTSYIN